MPKPGNGRPTMSSLAMTPVQRNKRHQKTIGIRKEHQPEKDQMWIDLTKQRGTQCELHGRGCSGKATDLHEILGRAHVRVEYQHLIPVELRSLLCRTCNMAHGDSETGRSELLEANIRRYGFNRVLAAYLVFVMKCGGIRYPVIETLLA